MRDQSDFVGDTPEPPGFKDIRNTRPVVADEKAMAALRLNRLVKAVPACVNAGGVELTRNWLKVQKESLKVLNNTRSSVNDLNAACEVMQRFTQILPANFPPAEA